MKEIIIHIGHGKTGTSYIQSFLALNREKLLDIGVDYPEHESFAAAKKGYISSGNGLVFERNIYQLDSLYKKDKVLFSNENFYHQFLLEKNKLFKEFAQKYKNQLTIILYSRNLFSQLFSTWAQTVKRMSQVNDINAFLRQPKLRYHDQIIDWIDLSNEIGFKLIFRNYSKHKKDLLDTFLRDLLGNKKDNTKFDLPPNDQINRSLTFPEYEFQRVCNYLQLSRPDLSDLLVNQLPEIKAMKLKCDEETYYIVKEKNLKTINKINKYVSKNESIIIESLNQVAYKNNDENYNFLSIDQIKIIASYFEKNRKPLDDKYINQIRDLAVKIANNESVDLNDALRMMIIAKVLRPEGEFIKKSIRKWDRIITTSK